MMLAIDNSVKTVHLENNSVAIDFDPHKLSASTIIKSIVNNYNVSDISIEEASLETVIKRVYEDNSE